MKNFFNDTDQIEIEKLYQKINSESIHVNYHKIFEQYASDKEYRNDLIQMIKIIQKEENLLLKMKEIINEVSGCSYSFYPDIQKMHNEIEFTIKDINVADYLRSSGCKDFVDGANCAIAGTFFLFIGLAVMTLSVCCRRVDMGYFEKIENSSPITPSESHTISAYAALLFPTEESKESFVEYRDEPKSKSIEDYVKGVIEYENVIYIFRSFFYKYVHALEGYGYCFYINEEWAYKDLKNNIRTDIDYRCVAFLSVFLDKRKVTELEDPEKSLKIFVETNPQNIKVGNVYRS